MYQILFCKATRRRFTSMDRAIARQVREERRKKFNDEFKRQESQAKALIREVLADAPSAPCPTTSDPTQAIFRFTK